MRGLLFCLALLAGCSETPEQREEREARNAEREMIFQAKYRLEQAMRDPDSMELRAERVGQGTYMGQPVVCGEINGRNGFGGMTGFRRFVVVGGVVPIVEPLMSDEREVFEDAWLEGGC